MASAYAVILKTVNTLTDVSGRAMDRGICPTVAALWLHGIDTDNSCIGHADIRLHYPWVRVSSGKFKLRRLLREFYGDRKPRLYVNRRNKLRPKPCSLEEGRREMRAFTEWLKRR